MDSRFGLLGAGMVDMLGGMGSVFLVERSDGHFKQTAALKILKGESVPKNVVLGTKIFTKENVDRGGEEIR